MILHRTHGTEFLQHRTITMAIPNIIPATAVRRTQVIINRGTRLTSRTSPPYGDLKPSPQNYGDLKPPTQGRAPMLFTSRGTSPHDLQVSPYSINIPGPLVMVLVCPRGDLGEQGSPPEKSRGRPEESRPQQIPQPDGEGPIWGAKLTCGIKLHSSESYQAGMFIAAPGARGIAPPNLHTKSRSMHLFITKLI